jgi:predicted transcriptional regulator YdeE
MNASTAKINEVVNSYWNYQIANEFKHRVKPYVTYSVYTDYESDEDREYTYFIGEEVSSLESQDMSKFTSLTIPKSKYQRFTTEPGILPQVVISAWKEIWQMTPPMLEGKRRYKADFEKYDERSYDLNNSVVDIYVGIE